MASKCTGFHVLQKILSRRQLTGGGSTCVLHQNQDSEESEKWGLVWDLGPVRTQSVLFSKLRKPETQHTLNIKLEVVHATAVASLLHRLHVGLGNLIQHSFGSDHADVYHFGYHECELKQEVANDRDYTKEWVKKYPGLSFRDLKTTVIQTFLDDHNTLGAKMAAERITYRAYRSCKHTLRLESDSAEVSTQSIEAVMELKKGSDEIDKYYIYEVNNSAMNNLPDYVIKSSSTVLRFAIQMDQSGPQNILQDEDCYFDGSYSRCKDFVSLGLWLRHPSMRRIVKLAGMETKKEDTVSITIFFK